MALDAAVRHQSCFGHGSRLTALETAASSRGPGAPHNPSLGLVNPEAAPGLRACRMMWRRLVTNRFVCSAARSCALVRQNARGDQGGTGLGPAIARTIAHGHDGQLTARNPGWRKRHLHAGPPYGSTASICDVKSL